MLNVKEKKASQLQVVCTEELVPKNHLLRRIEKAIDWSFIYELVEDKYSKDNGRPSIDPVTLIKIPILQYLYGIKSMRQTIKEIEVNVAYRWFLGLDLTDEVPHFTTFGKNYKRRFEGTDIFEQIFARILEECIKNNLVKPKEIFVDATHVKACANRKKFSREAVEKEALFYEEQLKKEIGTDREEHGKKPLKDEKKDDDGDNNGGSSSGGEIKEEKCSTTDPESGWFHKGEHKEEFAYSIQTACDKHGWILGYTVNRGNLHDSRTFKDLYDKLKEYAPEKIIADAGYKTPAIAKLLIDDGVTPIFPYKRPMTKDGFFKKYDYVYDEYYDCFICPNNKILSYSTTNRDGYREYKSCPQECKSCPYLSQCTESKNRTKVVTRHIWEHYIEQCEDIRHIGGNKELYEKRKETVERLFGTAKEHHGFRYTQMIGKAKMQMKVSLTFACLNLKKLANLLHSRAIFTAVFPALSSFRILLSDLFRPFTFFTEKSRLLLLMQPALSSVCGGSFGAAVFCAATLPCVISPKTRLLQRQARRKRRLPVQEPATGGVLCDNQAHRSVKDTKAEPRRQA